MEAFHDPERPMLSRETPHTPEQDALIEQVGELFDSSDKEIIRILSQYLHRQEGEI